VKHSNITFTEHKLIVKDITRITDRWSRRKIKIWSTGIQILRNLVLIILIIILQVILTTHLRKNKVILS